MSRPAQQLGKLGERRALEHLQQRGYAIVTTNWRCPFGEIDIVARQGSTLVFVEVRSRHAAGTEAAFASIGARKRARIEQAAQAYLSQHEPDGADWRIDVIAVALPLGRPPIVEHIEDALGW